MKTRFPNSVQTQFLNKEPEVDLAEPGLKLSFK
jgi:hypothetical protein